MPATGKSSLPAPHNYEEESRAKRAERKAAFIRETSRQIYINLLNKTAEYKTAAGVAAICAGTLAKELEERGYL